MISQAIAGPGGYGHVTQAPSGSTPGEEGEKSAQFPRGWWMKPRGSGCWPQIWACSSQGNLLLLEHVRAQGKIVAWVQDALVPVTTHLAGNCHWNRDTWQGVLAAGFLLTQVHQIRGGSEPVLRLSAIRPEQ